MEVFEINGETECFSSLFQAAKGLEISYQTLSSAKKKNQERVTRRKDKTVIFFRKEMPEKPPSEKWKKLDKRSPLCENNFLWESVMLETTDGRQLPTPPLEEIKKEPNCETSQETFQRLVEHPKSWERKRTSPEFPLDFPGVQGDLQHLRG